METIIVGDVFDSRTGEPIPAANIRYLGTKVGCSSNEEGTFFLRSDVQKACKLVVSAVGFNDKIFTIEPGQNAGIQVEMEEKNTLLHDVFVRPGVNPALYIINQVRINRERNDLTLRSSWSTNISEDQVLYISDLQRKHLQRALWKSLKAGTIQTTDSSYVVPIYCSNQHLRISQNGTEPISLPQTKTLVLTETDYSQLLSNLSSQINFYQNSILFYSRSFVSPLSTNGNTYYNYYLVDSLQTNDGKQYVVDFRTKNSFYPTFNGSLRIDSSSWAVRTVEAEIPYQNGINYLSSLRIQQNYSSDLTLQTEDISLILDFAVRTDTSHIFPTVLYTRKRIALTSANGSVDEVNLQSHDDISQAIDSLQSLPVVKVAKFFAYIIQTSYIPTGTYFEIGKCTNIISLNEVEGLRLGLPIRTSEKLWPHLSLEAMVGYGFRDKSWKGLGMVQYQLPTPRRHILGATYQDQYIHAEVDEFDLSLRENSAWFQDGTFTYKIFGFIPSKTETYNSLARKREFALWSKNDWTDNIETEFKLSVGRMGNEQSAFRSSYNFSSLSALLRVSFEERKVDRYFFRYHVYSRYPIIYFGAQVGTYQFGEDAPNPMYGRLSLRLRHQLPLGVCGQLEYIAEGGVVLGKVPYHLLNVFMSNQTYAYDIYRFTLMNNYQYAADKYFLLHADWDMQGLLFNLIPGIRFLRFHELLSFKLAWGGLNEKHFQVMTPPTHLSNLAIPYVEVGVGIGNILRVAEIRSVWRLTHRSDLASPLWGIRFRIHLQ